MDEFAPAYGPATRDLTERLLRLDTAGGREAPAADCLEAVLADRGFETYRWAADPETLATHPSFPDEPGEIPAADRPSVAGVLEAGDPDAGPTLVLNGHLDVVPATAASWSGDPFEPRWTGDDLTARGAADMKAGLAACVFAARHAVDVGDFDGRVVVEGVAGEEDGGIGAAAAALDSPYPFERDAAIVAEPTDLRPVVATEGSAMVRLAIAGRAAHAATAWRGESVLPRFEAVRRAFADLAAERGDRVSHPLYADYPEPWPAVCGRVRAGEWASTVPASLTAEWRLGVAPGETVASVIEDYRDRLATVAAADEWLAEHPPTLDRFSVQFEPAAVSPDEPVVRAVRTAMARRGLAGDPQGVTYGADSRHFVGAGVPAVLFGPGTIEQAHFPDETVAWPDVLEAGATLSAAVRAFAEGRQSS